MKTRTKLSVLFPALCLTLAFSSCGGDDDVPQPQPQQGACMSDKVTLTETSVNDLTGVNNVQVHFDVKNTSNENFDITDINKRQKTIYAEMKITMADGSVYTEEQMMLTQLGAGQTKTVTLSCDYPEGKVFQSYNVKTYCKD